MGMGGMHSVDFSKYPHQVRLDLRTAFPGARGSLPVVFVCLGKCVPRPRGSVMARTLQLRDVYPCLVEVYPRGMHTWAAATIAPHCLPVAAAENGRGVARPPHQGGVPRPPAVRHRGLRQGRVLQVFPEDGLLQVQGLRLPALLGGHQVPGLRVSCAGGGSRGMGAGPGHLTLERIWAGGMHTACASTTRRASATSGCAHRARSAATTAAATSGTAFSANARAPPTSGTELTRSVRTKTAFHWIQCMHPLSRLACVASSAGA
jgi:hypothetical protein